MFERHREYRELHARQTTHVLVDGMPIVWLLRAFRHDVDRRHRTTWLDWFEVALGRAADSGRRIFVLGHSAGALKTGLERARRRWPGFEIDGADGYFDIDDAAACGAKVATINSFAPDILFVGMGMPKQEIFAARYRDEIAAPVVGLGGAAFAYFAGDQAAPPRWMGQAGLEWAYRLAKNPRRLAGRYTVEPVLLAAALTGRLVRICFGVGEMNYNASRFDVPEEGRQLPTPGEFVLSAWRSAVRHKRTIWISVLIFLALAIVYLVITPKEYLAVAEMVIDSREFGVAVSTRSSGPQVNSPVDASVVESEGSILQSENVARAVIKKLDLVNSPTFANPGGVFPLIYSTIMPVVHRYVAPKPYTDYERWRATVEDFQKRLTVKREGVTYVFAISFLSPDPQEAAKVANAVADAYVEDLIGAKFTARARVTSWMQDRLKALSEQATNAEAKVAAFKRDHSIVSTGGRLMDEQQVAELQSQLTLARAEKANANAKVDRLGGVYKNALKMASDREAGINADLDKAIRQSADTTAAQVQLDQLESHAQAYRALYDTFLQRFSETVQEQSSPATESRLITEASAPLKKSKPKTILTLAGATFVGGLVGFGVGWMREKTNRSLRSPDQIEFGAEAPLLASIPKAPRLALDTLSRETSARPLSLFSESIRELRVFIEVQRVEHGLQAVGFTSAIPGEGKSTIAINLAAIVAKSKTRVLLIDGDMRSRSLTSQIGCGPSGLVEVLAGAVRVEDAVLHDEAGKFDLLGVTATRSDASELLCSTEMKQLIAALKRSYDFIFVDLPPVLPVADAKAAATVLDGVVFVAEWNRTTVETLSEAVRTSGRLRERMLGVVFNKVDPMGLNPHKGRYSSS